MKRCLIIFLLIFSLVVAGCSENSAEVEETLPAVVVEEASPTPIAPSKSSAEEESIPCSLPLPGDENWTVVLCETFDDNRNAWDVETQDNPYAVYTSAIGDGKFKVDYAAKGFAGFQKSALTWFPIGKERDFILSVTGTMESAFSDVSWGVSFRGDGDSFFLFSIKNDGTYAFEIYENGEWLQLISRRSNNAIRFGEANTMRIEAGGQDFYFSINDELVNQFSGALLEGDEIQLIVSAKEGVRAEFSFDDMVLQN